MASRGVFSFGTHLWDPSHRFETSWLLPPCILFAFPLHIHNPLLHHRLHVRNPPPLGGCETVRRSFSYFTVLTYWGLGFYFLVSSVHTLSYSLRGRPLLDTFPRPLQALHSLFYTTAVTLPFLVTIVYWGLLYATALHALNSAFALFEVLLARTEPPPWLHLLWLVALLLGYLAVAYVTVATQGWYTYRFLDHDAVGGRAYVAAYVFGIAAGVVVVFLVVSRVIRLRRWLTEVKMGMDGMFARQPARSHVEMNTIGSKVTH
ncbi:hypothetical protein EsDP_00005143 [Epichloe bromicola]|uniref:FAR-17a/AIG1-like protein n=1 Tax=Epichloe bromicola TaxID=79588 RepID=A0ABQ0CTY0_9HYPO